MRYSNRGNMVNEGTFTVISRCIVCCVVITVLVVAHVSGGASTTVEVIPTPVEVKVLDGQFTLTSSTSIVTAETSEQVKGVAECLACHLGTATGFSVKVSTGSKEEPKNVIMLKLNETKDSIIGDEGYRLLVKPNRINIRANKAAGLFYGVQTLLGLLPPEIESPGKVEGIKWTVPCVEIVDYPRFAWRGLLLDVGRYFFTKEDVKQFIDRMARYKFNTFQMHLSDDQGWRVEIKKYPKLTEVGAWRVPRAGKWWDLDIPPKPGEKKTFGGFYTQEDVRELVAYAKSRFVTILPEFDMPGHSMAALAAYPHLSCTGGPFELHSGAKFYGKIQNTFCIGNDEVFEFIDGLFTEIAELFDHPYIHMGGDEAFKGFWADCPKCLSGSFEFSEYSGKGTVYTFSEIAAAPTGFDDEVPYTVVVVDLSEGGRLLAWLGDTIPSDQVAIGQEVQVVPQIFDDTPEIKVYYSVEKPGTTWGKAPPPHLG